MSDGKIDLPGGWSLVRDDDPTTKHHRCWFLCNPHDVWVAKFWDGPEAGAGDAQAFAKAINDASSPASPAPAPAREDTIND